MASDKGDVQGDEIALCQQFLKRQVLEIHFLSQSIILMHIVRNYAHNEPLRNTYTMRTDTTCPDHAECFSVQLNTLETLVGEAMLVHITVIPAYNIACHCQQQAECLFGDHMSAIIGDVTDRDASPGCFLQIDMVVSY